MPEPLRTVEWVSTLGGSQPRWITTPSLTAIGQLARRHLDLPAHDPCQVAFFAEGGFNKLYSIDVPGHACLIRVALPVEPRWKTLSEVATLEFVRRVCTECVPKVLAYDDAGDDLGFEWMIMEKLPGRALEENWENMTWSAKEQLVKTIVGILAKLYDHTLSGIGNIYPEPDGSPSSSNTPTVGRIVSMVFFWDKHSDQDVDPGPFRSSHDWLASRLAFICNDAAETLRTSDDEDDREEAVESQALAERLVRLLPTIFPPQVDAPERTVIHHDDLSFHNLLVDETGQLTGIVDWECVSALPLWKACQLPSFLVSPHRAERPRPEAYAADEDGRPKELYFEHLREWEKSQLRAVFFQEMVRVRPEWVHEHHAAKRQIDFDLAVEYCDDELSRKTVERWVDQVERMNRGEVSEHMSLRAQLMG
ncbi:kinase-like domain-containing protein [Amylostereum chailletii]|nr:kinase-like domain-containing protein [Amylostereum chailletii]